MKKIIISFFFILSVLSAKSQCDAISMSVSSSTETSVQLYTAAFFFTPSSFDNLNTWVVTDMSGNLVHEATTTGDWASQSFMLFDHMVPVTETMNVCLNVFNPVSGVDCEVCDVLTWTGPIGNWEITEGNLGTGFWPDLAVELGEVVDVTCFGASDGMVTVIATGGSPNYRYSIDGGPFTISQPTFENVGPGLHEVVVNDNFDMPVSIMVEVFEPEELLVGFETIDVTCFGGDDGQITIFALGGTNDDGYDYYINGDGPFSSEILGNLEADIYEIEVEDDNGCVTLEFVEIFQPAQQQEIPYNGIDDDCDPATLDDDLDQDGFTFANDCDDNNAGINPGVVEVPYNGIDEDCNPATFDDDLDQDGFAFASDCDDNNAGINPGVIEVPYNGIDEDCNPATLDDDLDQDGFAFASDCDDNNAGINPGAIEIVNNGIDEDCDGADLTQGIDSDGDGYSDDVDCDDSNAEINPGVVEVPYNGVDEDCNPATLDDDLDQDGYVLANDCDDNNAGINPGATEIINNGVDEDCNGVDLTQGIDSDGDGYTDDVDCDDSNVDINPGQSEVPYNGVDDDCDPETPDDDLDNDGFSAQVDCNDTNAGVNPGQLEIPYNGIDDDCENSTLDDDLDQDGFLLEDDCDDNNDSINPGQAEVPYNGIDEDCNPATLDDDLDQDGFVLENDCDDNNADINPDGIEIVNNGIDEDCDGVDLITSTHELTDETINIYPNPTSDVLNIEVDGMLQFAITIYSLEGKVISKSINENRVFVSSIPSGIYLLEVQDLETRKKVTQKIIKN